MLLSSRYAYTRPPPARHHEVYRGIGFHITLTGYFVFDKVAPPCVDGQVRDWAWLAQGKQYEIIDNRDADDVVRVTAAKTLIDECQLFWIL